MASIEYDNGTIKYYQNGLLHRLDGPAIYCDSYKAWYQNGQRHRLNGPAIEFDGHKAWYQNGKRHRLDGHAIEHANGQKEWFQNGQKHRLDGPAVEHVDGYKIWYQNGQRHRIDGPAVEHVNGYKEWGIFNIDYSETEFNHKIHKLIHLWNSRFKLKPNEAFCKWWFNPANTGGKLAIQDLIDMFPKVSKIEYY